jgi:hypothetical protein
VASALFLFCVCVSHMVKSTPIVALIQW